MHRPWMTMTISALVLCCTACGNDTRRGAADLPSTVERFPRLTHAQWEATIQDLFGFAEPTGLAATFQPDPQLGRFDNNAARLEMTSGLWRDYQRAAETVAERVVGDAETLKRLVGDPEAIERTAFVTTFGTRAFRRPLTDAEVARYALLFDVAPALFPEHDPAVAGVRLVIQNMLQSPFFLYRAELSTDETKLGIVLDGYEVASRLSYLLWNTLPDDELFAAAADGTLDTADGVRDQALRLLEHPRARAQLRRFHVQVFGLAEYADLDKNTERFPTWRRELGPMMQEETLRFLDDVIEHDGGVFELLTSTRAFVNAELAELYGVELDDGELGDEYREVQLDSATRAGLLTRVGFLARNATLDEPDPIHRGVFINLNILCRSISAPPDIPDNLMKTGETNRERVESITGEGTCGAQCHHTIINPLGFAFEGYDAIGAVRETDNGHPIDSAATYTFSNGRSITFANAVELSHQLATAPEAHACYTANLLELMLGRSLYAADRRVAYELAERSLADRLSIKELLLSAITSNTFRMRARIDGRTP